MKKLILILSIAFIGVLVFFSNVTLDQSSNNALLNLNKVALAQALVLKDKVCCCKDPGDTCVVGSSTITGYDECSCD